MPSPSDALAELNVSLTAYLSILSPTDANQQLETAEASLVWTQSVDPWTLSARSLTGEPDIVRAASASARGIVEADLPVVIAAMQRLDQWHSPLTDRGAAMGHRSNDDHVTASVLLETDARLNADPALGSLILKRTESWRTCADHTLHDGVMAGYGSGGWLKVDVAVYRTADLMESTAFLPLVVTASHQDAGGGADRPVALRYHRVTAQQDMSSPGAALNVMLAPVLEVDADVVVAGDASGRCYDVRPVNVCARIDEIVRAAFDGNVDVLFMPEMSLSPASADGLVRSLRRHRKASIARTLAMPRLCWVIAGVMDERLLDGANHVVVLDADGEEVARQEKISRWNMDPDQQAQFDLVRAGAAAVTRMDEPIRGAPEVVVVDLPGLGRMTTLICADMDIALPGNWMFANAGLDLVYAPIMDKTTPVRAGSALDVQPWIVRRSFRAAAAARARVVMTNSMPLTEVVNRTNASRGVPRPPFTDCLVGLLVDGTEVDMPYLEVSVPLQEASPVMRTVVWNDRWKAYDLPHA